jgi:hypothetical protein
MPEIHVWPVQCRPPLGCGTTAVTEIRVYGPTYIFTCGKCGEAAGGLVADMPEKDKISDQRSDRSSGARSGE